MISRNCIITVNGNKATIDSDIYLYKYDKNIQLVFSIINSKYMYDNDDSNNLIKNMQAAYAQVKFKKDDSTDIEIEFDIQATSKGAVLLTINEELTDEDTELGEYTIQIRLLDSNKNSVVTLPPVESCIHIQAPLFEKMGSDTNVVNKAVVNKAVARYAAPLSATTADGTFNSKEWADGDKITTAELNRMEQGIKTNSTQYKDIANLSLTKHTDGKVYIKKQDGTLIGDGLEIGGSDVDLSKITMNMSGQTLKLLNDGTQIATVEIPTAVVTDEQLTSIIQSKIDDGTLTSITLGENSVKTSNLQDNSVTVAKLSNAILDVDTLEKSKVITIGDINLSETPVTIKTVMPDGNKPTYTGHLSEKIKISTGGVYMVKGHITKNPAYSNQLTNYGFSNLNSMVYIYDKDGVFLKTGTNLVMSPNFNDANVSEGEYIAYLVIPDGGGYIQIYTRYTDDKNYSNLYIYSNPCMIDNKYTTKCNIHDNYLSCVKSFNILNYDSLTIASGLGKPCYFVSDTNYLNEYGFVEFIELIKTFIYIKIKLHHRFVGGKDFIRIFCYDENFNYINKIFVRSPYGSNDATDVNVSFTATAELPSNTKYIKVSFNGNFKNLFDLNHDCFKISYAPFREDSDEHYIENNLLNNYVNEHITNSIDLKSYKFTKLGALNPIPPVKYTCWNNNTMIYDKDVDKFIQICRGRETHTTGTQKSYISKINAKTLQSEDIIEVKIADNVVSNAIGLWCADNTYYSTCLIDKTVHRISSTDKCITWVDDGVVSGNKGNFYSIHKLSNGRLIGTHDDLVVPTSTKDKSYIDYSDDNGMTWTVVEINSSYPTVEQFFIELDDVLVMVGRRNGYPNSSTGKLRGYDAGICYSYDKGLTWTDCKKSNNLCMNCSNGVYFEHDGLIEIITVVRFSFDEISIRVPNRNGCIYHYVTTKELLLQDKYYLLETFYDGSSSFSHLHSPSIGVDSENNVLISYSSDETVANLTELHYLYGTNKFNVKQNVVNDKRPSNLLPYSGAKVEELLNALKKELTSK